MNQQPAYQLEQVMRLYRLMTMVYWLEASQRLLQTIDALDNHVDYWYDAGGSPYMVSDAEENIITTKHNLLGRKTEVDDPNMGVKTFAYQ